MEHIVVVNRYGILRQVKSKNELAEQDIVAVELVLVFLPDLKQIVLFNRSSSASDMQNHWSLESGKVRQGDLMEKDNAGNKLSDQAFMNAAIRELKEELNFQADYARLRKVDQFYMPSKRIYFTLFSLPISVDELSLMQPDPAEIDRLNLFSLADFAMNESLGDAICYRKEKIIDYLEKQFLEIQHGKIM